MLKYWGRVSKRAWKEAAGLVGFGSAERAIVTVGLQAAIGLLIYLLLGGTALHNNMGMRMATALAPLAILPALFVWKLIAIPAAIHGEHLLDEDTERRTQIIYLSGIYVQEEKPANAELIRHYLAYPPEEWFNAKLEELGFLWRVNVHPGARITTYDAPATIQNSPV